MTAQGKPMRVPRALAPPWVHEPRRLKITFYRVIRPERAKQVRSVPEITFIVRDFVPVEQRTKTQGGDNTRKARVVLPWAVLSAPLRGRLNPPLVSDHQRIQSRHVTVVMCTMSRAKSTGVHFSVLPNRIGNPPVDPTRPPYLRTVTPNPFVPCPLRAAGKSSAELLALVFSCRGEVDRRTLTTGSCMRRGDTPPQVAEATKSPFRPQIWGTGSHRREQLPFRPSVDVTSRR
jgi:hypothetical protein